MEETLRVGLEAEDRVTRPAGRARDSLGRFVSAGERAGESVGRALGNPRIGAAFSSFITNAEKAGEKLSVALSAPLALLGYKMSQAFAESDSQARGLATLEKNATTLGERLKTLESIARLPGLGLPEVKKGDIVLRTVLERMYGIPGAAKQSERFMRGLGNAIATAGKGRAEFDRAVYSIQQLANTEFPLGEDLNILKDAIPQVTPLLIEAFGTARTEDLQKLKITSKQVMETVVAGLEKLPPAAGGWKNALENMSDSTDKAFSKIFGSIYRALDLQAIFDKLGSMLETAADKFESLSPGVQKIIAVFAILAIAVPPLLAGLGMLATTVLPAVAAGFAAITGPVGLVIAAIAVAATLIIMHWDKVKKALVDSGIWDTLREVVKAALGVIVSIFGVFANLLQGDWHALWEHFKNIFKYAWNGILKLAFFQFKVMGGLIAKALELMGADTWAASIQKGLQQAEKTLNNYKFDVPQLAGLTANLFEGFNFGGDRTVNTGKKNPAEGLGKKGAKLPEFDSYLETLQKRAGEVEKQIQSIVALGGKVPGPLYDELEKLIKILEKAQKATERTNLPDAKPIPRPEFENEKGPLKHGLEGRLEGIGKQMKKTVEDLIPPIDDAMARLRQSISAGLQSAAESAIVGMGELIGGMVAGVNGLSALPKMFGMILGALAKDIGKSMISFGVAGIALKKLAISPGGAIAAGVALTAMGAALQASVQKKTNSVPALAEGGLVYGDTMVRVGEYSDARVRPELIAPVNKVQGYIQDAVETGGGPGGPIEVFGELYAEGVHVASIQGGKRRAAWG